MAERHRNREMTGYFAAVGIDVDETGRLRSSSPTAAEPSLCSDAVLNALTQTGALRLGCERAFVSLIGQHWQYIIAEASAELPYRRCNLKPTDRMCMGFTAISSEMAICLNTLKCFTDSFTIDDGNTQANSKRYRIRDLTADSTFCARPYVTGWPYIRSYLEVPLTTSTGLVIGSYCVVDPNLRDDFGDSAMPVMTEVAQNIMDHLDLLKTKQQCERANRLVRGLSVFVAGCSSLRDVDTANPDPPVSDESPLDVHRTRPPLPDPSSGSSLTTDVFSLATPASSATDVDSLDFDESPQPFSSPQTSSPPSPLPTPPHDPKVAFSRAANLIREATSIEGIVFLDACPTGFGSLQTTGARTSRSSADDIDGPTCEILGSSTGSHTAPVTERLKMPELLLQRLIHSNSRGGLIYADENGPISACMGAADEKLDKEDVGQLLAILPQARSIMFLPLWDYQKDTWYAAAMAWTTDAARPLEEGDMTYISAFSNSIMAEVARLDALVTSAAKGDFISSISHEFRSPLHGIMASTELLDEVVHDPDQRQLTRMIRSCASTLIDTTNHLLDFAKINKLAKDEQQRPARPALGRSSLSYDQSALGQGAASSSSLSSMVDLAQLIEDVVESAFAGNASQAALKSSKFPTGPAVAVTTNIQRRDGWSLWTEPGAWKRIVMNIVGNALKYTARGSVAVSLSATATASPHRTDVCFTVTDTGCGMSNDYLKRQLFTPYSQETPLSPGVGLGLSIVQRLVKELGGAIEVQSTPAVGTLVRVTVPGVELLGAADDVNTDPGQDVVDALRGKAVAALDLDGSPTLLPAFAAMAETWLGVDVVRPADETGGAPPLVVLCKSAPGVRLKERASFENATFLVQPFGPRKLLWTVARAFTRHAASMSAAATAGPPTLTTKEEERVQRERKGRKDGSKGADLARWIENLSMDAAPPPEDPKADLANTEPTAPTHPPQQPQSTPQPPAPPSTIPATPALRSPHVLAVDDNGVNLKILTTHLKKMKCTYETATNGLEAVQRFAATTTTGHQPFDYIFMDISMPVMDGFEATREIRALEKSNNLPRVAILALTGLGAESSQREAFVSGVDVYLMKPVPLKKLKELVLGAEGA